MVPASSDEPALGEGPPRELTQDELLQFAAMSRQAAESALGFLNGSVNWAMTLSLAVALFVAQFDLPTQPPGRRSAVWVLLAVVSLSFAILLNFFVRTTKNYLNLIRFAILERRAIEERLRIDPRSENPFEQDIQSYHLRWACPLLPRTAIWKVFREFGFIFWFIVHIALLFYLTGFLAERWGTLSFVSIVWLLLLGFEYLSFRSSPYTREIVMDGELSTRP